MCISTLMKKTVIFKARKNCEYNVFLKPCITEPSSCANCCLGHFAIKLRSVASHFISSLHEGQHIIVKGKSLFHIHNF